MAARTAAQPLPASPPALASSRQCTNNPNGPLSGADQVVTRALADAEGAAADSSAQGFVHGLHAGGAAAIEAVEAEEAGRAARLLNARKVVGLRFRALQAALGTWGRASAVTDAARAAHTAAQLVESMIERDAEPALIAKARREAIGCFRRSRQTGGLRAGSSAGSVVNFAEAAAREQAVYEAWVAEAKKAAAERDGLAQARRPAQSRCSHEVEPRRSGGPA